MAQFNLGVTYAQQNNVNEAIEAYQRVPKDVTNLYAHAQYNLGATYAQQARQTRRLKPTRTSPMLPPQNTRSTQQLGRAL